MTKVSFLLAVSVFFAIILFISCEKNTEINDNQSPQISDVRFNRDDTIYVNGDTILINKNGAVIDTLVAGSYLKLSAIFKDNLALSSYRIEVDTLSDNPNNSTDTAFLTIKSQYSIFGKNVDTLINKQEFLIMADSVYDSTGRYRYLQEGKYQVQLACVDKAGNVSDTIIYVYIMRQQTLINERKNQ